MMIDRDALLQHWQAHTAALIATPHYAALAPDITALRDRYFDLFSQDLSPGSRHTALLIENARAYDLLKSRGLSEYETTVLIGRMIRPCVVAFQEVTGVHMSVPHSLNSMQQLRLAGIARDADMGLPGA